MVIRGDARSLDYRSFEVCIGDFTIRLEPMSGLGVGFYDRE